MIKLRNILLESSAKNKSKYLRRLYEQAAEAAPGMTINQKLTEIGKQLEQANGKAQAAINTIIKLPDLKKIKFSGLGWPSQSENNPADVQVSFAPSGAGYSNCRLLIYPGRNDQSGYNKLGFWYLEGNARPTLEISIPCYGFRADQEKIVRDAISKLANRLVPFAGYHSASDKGTVAAMKSQVSAVISAFEPVVPLAVEFLNTYPAGAKTVTPILHAIEVAGGDKPYVAPGTAPAAAAPAATAPTTPPAQG
jgi:hypothetical protein